MGTTKKAAKAAGGKASSKKPLDGKSAFESLLPRIDAIKGDVPVMRFSASLARANADRAASAIAPYLATMKQWAPKVDARLVADVPTIARALEFAETQTAKARSDGAIERALGTLRPIREATLAYLEGAAFCGLVDTGRVAAIRAGAGRLDLAKDGLAIAALFDDEKATLRQKHPFTDEQLATLRDTSAWLVDRLKPSGAVRDKKTRSLDEVRKDRLAKLLEDAYAELRRAAVAIWGLDEATRKIPALHAHAAAPKKKPPSPKPASPPAQG